MASTSIGRSTAAATNTGTRRNSVPSSQSTAASACSTARRTAGASAADVDTTLTTTLYTTLGNFERPTTWLVHPRRLAPRGTPQRCRAVRLDANASAQRATRRCSQQAHRTAPVRQRRRLRLATRPQRAEGATRAAIQVLVNQFDEQETQLVSEQLVMRECSGRRWGMTHAHFHPFGCSEAASAGPVTAPHRTAPLTVGAGAGRASSPTPATIRVPSRSRHRYRCRTPSSRTPCRAGVAAAKTPARPCCPMPTITGSAPVCLWPLPKPNQLPLRIHAAAPAPN